MFIVILAIHHHVAYTLNVEILMDLHHAHVWQHTLDPLQTVDLNVQSTLSVLVTKLVYKRNVGIHVLDLVVSMQFVLSSVIHQRAHVQKETLAIPSRIVTQNLLHVRHFCFSTIFFSYFKSIV
jgi:hypothetical protein